MALWVASLINTDPAAHTHLLAGGPKERIGRWLTTLAVPTVPPCPIGGSAATKPRLTSVSSADKIAHVESSPTSPSPPKRKGPGSAPRRPPAAKK